MAVSVTSCSICIMNLIDNILRCMIFFIPTSDSLKIKKIEWYIYWNDRIHWRQTADIRFWSNRQDSCTPDKRSKNVATNCLVIYLFQPQFLAFKHVVVGVQHTRDIFGQISVNHRLNIIPVIEIRQIKTVGRACRPESHCVDGAVAIPRNRRVIWNRQHRLRTLPSELSIVKPLDITIKRYFNGVLWTRHFPWIPITQPIIWDLLLEALANFLSEDAVFISQPCLYFNQFNRNKWVCRRVKI